MSICRVNEKSAPFFAEQEQFQHTLAILSMPSTSADKIANEAILNQAVRGSRKLSVVLRASREGKQVSLARLRQYVGEVYSALWDAAVGAQIQGATTSSSEELCDVVVYPHNLPNTASEQWIHDAPDLDSVCSHSSICKWTSLATGGRGLLCHVDHDRRFGGLEELVEALNDNRQKRRLQPVQAIPVDIWPTGVTTGSYSASSISFLDDEEDERRRAYEDSKTSSTSTTKGNDDFANENDLNAREDASWNESDKLPSGSLYEHVAVAGTFDGMHYGHRKLLTLAISSVNPTSGKLLVGVTADEMLQHKSFCEEIPTVQQRMQSAREFIHRLAPGIKDRIQLIPIFDEYGPPGTLEEGKDYDALVLSHETLNNGCKLNRHRVETLGIPPLNLLCTRRTEPHGMSSTALRKRRFEERQQQKPQRSRSQQ